MKTTAHSSATLNSANRLRKIDKLRENNIGTHLPLPQLVAVGDQSSGKSSLLESLTGIPFPRAQTLCTRYATQITHRRDDLSHISIGIIPGPHASDDDKERLSSYVRAVNSTAELRAQFPVILDEVNKLMGIKTPNNPSGTKTFTEDVLRVEKCGPNEDYLTIIDVPGIFRLVEEGVVTPGDKVLVRSMVEKYIKDARTVILAVLPCTSDVFTQEILALAEEYDIKGERTLGILTKPDLLSENRAKASICDMVNGKRKPLNLGYYVVRNKGADDPDDDAGADSDDDILAEREVIFREEPWSSLPRERLGVKALRERLQDLLGQITDRSFPFVRMETRHMLAQCRKLRDELGDPRQTEHEQQKYLMGIAARFQSLARTALEADYSSDQAFSNDHLRLITAVINLTGRFNERFIQSSPVYAFQTRKPSSDRSGESLMSTLVSSLVNGLASMDIAKPDDAELEEFPELEAVITDDWATRDPKEGIMAWIDSLYSRSRGVDLFSYSSKLPGSAFREQSADWASMTQQYISKIIFVLHRFIIYVLNLICTDKALFEKVKSSILDGDDGLLARYEKAMKKAIFLVNVERDQKPYTLSQDFSSLVEESRTARQEPEQDSQTPNGQLTPPSGDNKDNKEQVKEEIFDKLQAYYDIASKRFLDNVFRQAVDYHLLTGPDSPLRVFSEQWVIGLSKERLDDIAGEPRAIREKREGLDKKIEDLEAAIKILQ
ncbi:P-loop containing nucleoside triphosphate hydrolase protein [Rhypophila decipiens]